MVKVIFKRASTVLVSLVLFMTICISSVLADDFDNNYTELKLVSSSVYGFFRFNEEGFNQFEVGSILSRKDYDSVFLNYTEALVYSKDTEKLSIRNIFNVTKTFSRKFNMKSATTLSYVGYTSNYNDGAWYASQSLEATYALTKKFYLYAKKGGTWDIDSGEYVSGYELIAVPYAINRTTFLTPNIVRSEVKTPYYSNEETNFALELTFLF